jgi:opacity protein-like surface antigen
MPRLSRYLPLSLLLCVPFAHAQSAVDFNVGFGTARDSSTGLGIDNLNSATNALGGCVPGTGDANCQATSSLGGFFLGFGGDVMFREHFGAGAEINVQPTHQRYGPLQSRQSFIDLNGIYAPITNKRATLQLQGGIGSARTSFVLSQTGCVGTAVCSTSASPVGTATHFQVHLGVGVQIALTEHIFVRPQFDYHYVPNLTDQYGRNSVPEATIWVGYHFGEH